MLRLLTASYSVAQFFATPVLGTLSDRLGRKLILALSLLGTCLSFVYLDWQTACGCYLPRGCWTCTGGKSTGLGLYFAKETIESHGGRIWFESAENTGTTFFIEMPKC